MYVYSRNNKKFSVSKDGNQIATDQSRYVLTKDGTYTIAINKDNEVEEHIVKIDKTQPIINSIEIADITSNSFKIKVNTEDTLSGIKQIRYSTDDGKNWKTPTENINECIITDIDLMFTDYQIKIEAEDMAGNVVTKEQTQTALLSDMKIGDYVAYTPSSANSYNVAAIFSGYSSNQSITQDTTLKWKVLNIDKENKTIDIVSATPTSNSVYLSGALGYNNGIYLLNDICEKLYSNSSKNIKARSINLEDMEKHFTDAGFKARNEYKDEVKYGETKTYTSNKLYPCAYGSQIGAGINITTITQPNIIKTVDPYKESERIYPTPTVLTSNTAGSNGLTVTQTLYRISINSANYGEAETVLLTSSTYWIASRYVYTSSNNVDFGIRCTKPAIDGHYMIDSKGAVGNISDYLYPVASCKATGFYWQKNANNAWIIK